MKTVKKHQIDLKVRRIDNGYIVTGAVSNRIGSRKFPESFVPDLRALDMAISERLGGAEKIAGEIVRDDTPRTVSFFSLRGWDDDDDDD